MALSEKDIEDIICKYPELIENDLILKGRQVHISGKIADMLFEDKFGHKLIIELKGGTILRKHVGQIMEYAGGTLTDDDPTTRAMLIGNRVPPNIQKALDHFGVEWKELTYKKLEEFLTSKNDYTYVSNFNQARQEIVSSKQRSSDESKDSSSGTEVSVDSFLSIIEDPNILKRINVLRQKIKSLGNGIEEYARKWTWIMYKLNRQFCGIDVYKKHFIVFINLPLDLVSYTDKLDIARLKDKHYIKVKIHPETDLDLLFENIKKAYQRQL